MSKDCYFNGTELTGIHDVFFNGVAMDNVYLNNTHVWQKHLYTPGTHLIGFNWNPQDGMHGMRTTHWNTYGTVMFKQQPYYISSGTDTRLVVNLQPGFNFSSYTQSQYGTDPDGQGAVTGTGQSSTLYSGNSVSGASGFNIAGSGNGDSSINIGYSGQ